MNLYKAETLSSLCHTIADCPHSTPAWTSTGKIVIRNFNIKAGRLDLSDPSYTDAEHFNQRIKREKPIPGDLILTREAPMGEVCIIPDDVECCLGQRMVLLKPNKEKCNNVFLLYSILSKYVQNQIAWNEGTGTTVSNLRIPFLEALKIPTPPLPEQRAIAAILSALDDKIELNRQMNRTLEEMAQAIFKHWFVDFGPFRDGGMQDSELGPIPVGWRVGTLGEIAGFLNGYAFKSQDWTDKGVPVVKIGSVKPGYVDLNQVSYVSDDVAMQAQRYRLFAGDILVGMTGYVGEVGLVPICDCNPLLNQRVGKIEMRSDGLSERAFLFCLLRQPSFKFFVESRAHGTAQANASSKDITNFPTVIPPVETGCYFNKLVETFIQRILINRAEMTTLETIRDTLLPKLMSGELRVPVSDNAG